MSRIAVVSDIHGNLPALDAVIADALTQGCDRFINLGDSLSGPLWPAETADRLIALDWPTIAGNHERQLLGKRERMGTSDAFAAAQGAGIALVPARLFDAELRAQRLVKPFDIELAAGRYWLTHLQSKALTAPMEQFRDWLTAACDGG